MLDGLFRTRGSDVIGGPEQVRLVHDWRCANRVLTEHVERTEAGHVVIITTCTGCKATDATDATDADAGAPFARETAPKTTGEE